MCDLTHMSISTSWGDSSSFIAEGKKSLCTMPRENRQTWCLGTPLLKERHVINVSRPRRHRPVNYCQQSFPTKSTYMVWIVLLLLVKEFHLDSSQLGLQVLTLTTVPWLQLFELRALFLSSWASSRHWKVGFVCKSSHGLYKCILPANHAKVCTGGFACKSCHGLYRWICLQIMPWFV